MEASQANLFYKKEGSDTFSPEFIKKLILKVQKLRHFVTQFFRYVTMEDHRDKLFLSRV
jgi:hypothetical protein